jgi:hypothetical protein
VLRVPGLVVLRATILPTFLLLLVLVWYCILPVKSFSMPYEVEDEIDWSDGPLSPETAKPPVTSNDHVQLVEEGRDVDYTSTSVSETPHELPRGSPLPFRAHTRSNNSMLLAYI